MHYEKNNLINVGLGVGMLLCLACMGARWLCIKGTASLAFSGLQAIMPLCGMMGVLPLCMLYMGTWLLRLMGTWCGMPLPLCFGLPTFCAGLYWSVDNRLFKVGIPLLCMALFVLHPVGCQAWAYSLYWLIPAYAALRAGQGPFLQALGSTFTAHAVGSVWFIYAVNAMDASAWLTLIPHVAVERLFFASLLYCGYHLYGYVQSRMCSASCVQR